MTPAIYLHSQPSHPSASAVTCLVKKACIGREWLAFHSLPNRIAGQTSSFESGNRKHSDEGHYLKLLSPRKTQVMLTGIVYTRRDCFQPLGVVSTAEQPLGLLRLAESYFRISSNLKKDANGKRMAFLSDTPR